MLDNFGGAAAWDRYCAAEDERLKYEQEHTKCKNCVNFLRDENKCFETGEDVDPEEYAIEFDCEFVEER